MSRAIRFCCGGEPLPQPAGGARRQWEETQEALISEHPEECEPFTPPRVTLAGASLGCHYPKSERLSVLGCLTKVASGSLALAFSWLWDEGGAHVLPQDEALEGGGEAGPDNKQGFSRAISVERATQTSMPKMSSGIFWDSRFRQEWSEASLPENHKQN